MTHFSLHIKVLAISVTFGLGSIVVALASQAASYTVTISSESPRAAVVEAQFRPDDGVIWMNDDGDQGLPHGWSTFVRGLEVRGPEGKPIDVVYEPLSRWRLEGTETGPLSVRYEVLLQHDRFPLNFGDNGAAYIRDGAVMWSGRALFLAGQEAQDIELQLNLPAEWKATTPWERVAGVPNRFEVVDTDDLVNSAFMVGSHLERVVRQGPLELRLALSGPEVASAEEIFASELAKYLQYYDSTIGPAPRRSMIVIAADSSYWGGEVMGRAISLSVTDEITGPNPMLAHLFAHETAHLWGLDINFAEDDKEELYWFYEGMLAEYLSYTANTRLGDISEDDLKAQLDEHYSKYKAAAEPGLSMSTVGHEKAAHYDLIYSGGMIAAAALDQAVREETGRTNGVEELIRTLYSNYPHASGSRAKLDVPTLDSDGISKVAAEIYGPELGARLRSWVDGTVTIPFDTPVGSGANLNPESTYHRSDARDR